MHEDLDMARLLALAHYRGASDLHLKVGNHPVLRVNGRLERAEDLPVLDVATVRTLIESIMTEEQRHVFQTRLELDFAYPLADGRGRVAAVEVMVATGAIRNLIREGKTHQIPSLIMAGGKDGMQSLNQALRDLVLARRTTYEEAVGKASSDRDLAELLGRKATA